MIDAPPMNSLFNKLAAPSLHISYCQLGESNAHRHKIASLYLRTLECLALSQNSSLGRSQIDRGREYSKVNGDEPRWQRKLNFIPLLFKLFLFLFTALVASVWHLSVTRHPRGEGVRARPAELGIGALIDNLVCRTYPPATPHPSLTVPCQSLKSQHVRFLCWRWGRTFPGPSSC